MRHCSVFLVDGNTEVMKKGVGRSKTMNHFIECGSFTEKIPPILPEYMKILAETIFKRVVLSST